MASPAERTITRAALALTCLVLTTRLWFVFHRAFDVDEFEHAHAAWCTARGLVPYRDFFEHHTPFLYLTFAPLFTAPVDLDPAAALRVLFTCRLAMLALTASAFALTFRLGLWWEGRLNGALAVALLATSAQFLNSMLDFRPDVPATVAVLAAMACAIETARRSSWRWAAASGAATMVAVLCTQKAVFAAPGILAGVALPRKFRLVAAFAAGAMIPAAATLAWFAARGSLRPFLVHTVVVNIELNRDRFSPFPRLLTNTLHHPGLYLLGIAGLVQAFRRRMTAARLVPAVSAASLLAGAFVVGKAYDQYYDPLLPLLAVAAAGCARRMFATAPSPSASRALSRAAFGAAIVGIAALIASVEPRTSARGAVLIGALSVTALLAAAAAALWAPRPATAGLLGLLALGSLLSGNIARTLQLNRRQIADLQWVTAQTAPSDTVLSGFQDVSAFRPHAWFYFFLSGPFPGPEDYAQLLRGLESRRVRPRLVVFNAYLRHAPPPILDYISAHYRQVRGDIYLRSAP